VRRTGIVTKTVAAGSRFRKPFALVTADDNGEIIYGEIMNTKSVDDDDDDCQATIRGQRTKNASALFIQHLLFARRRSWNMLANMQETTERETPVPSHRRAALVRFSLACCCIIRRLYERRRTS